MPIEVIWEAVLGFHTVDRVIFIVLATVLHLQALRHLSCFHLPSLCRSARFMDLSVWTLGSRKCCQALFCFVLFFLFSISERRTMLWTSPREKPREHSW